MRKFILPVFIVLACSCNNHNPRKEQEEILRKFDSVNKSLDNRFDEVSDRVRSRTEDIQIELALLSHDNEEVWSRIYELKEANHSFQDFTDSLKEEFTHFCGVDENGELSPGTEADPALTNRFFIERKNGRLLYKNIMSFAKAVRPVILTDTARDQLAQMTRVPVKVAPSPDPSQAFERLLFENTPPVAALTILAKYQDDAMAVRSTILREYYHKHVSSQKF